MMFIQDIKRERREGERKRESDKDTVEIR